MDLPSEWSSLDSGRKRALPRRLNYFVVLMMLFYAACLVATVDGYARSVPDTVTFASP